MRERRVKSGKKKGNFKSNYFWKRKFSSYLIDNLKNHGPVNLIHVRALSALIGTPVRVWHSRHRVCTLNGRNAMKDPIDIEYHECLANSTGHWTLLGDKDPVDCNVELDLNSCLFTVVAAQIGERTTDLREHVIKYLTSDPKRLIKHIDQFLTSNDGLLMNGGARYVGTSPRHAAVVLDNSQNVLCHGCKNYGHPRGHASHRNATGAYDSIENYSRTTGRLKSGFLSRSDQNHVAHLALRHKRARQAMQVLNNGSTSQVVELSRRELMSMMNNSSNNNRNNNNNYVLPKMNEYLDGEPVGDEREIMYVKFVIRHHEGKYDDPNADVFVHTFYPTS